ncbi:hypothetical protein [Leptospira sarikeiensis]|uniref:Uncharacterized protein n=1 Tax=Leptospira sarikeiensis TaxID=2484943 RepID=A0A4R9KFR4_9LEPT|nr:hypothetical protein [Leptospira sarikeiensis]TGL65927.1 hypothetical protein EHQ64_00350 [Leptospira sarikeiensis]
MSFRYVIAINLLIVFVIGCQAAKKEHFELPEIRKKFVHEVNFEKADFIEESNSYYQHFDSASYSYSVTWSAKKKLIAESANYSDLSEVFTYQDGKLSMKAKAKKHTFEPFYRENVDENSEQTEDSIFYYLK